MRLVKSNDFYSIKVRGYVTPLHLDVLDILYQPILGFAATSLYRYLYAMRDFRKGDPLSFTLIHDHFGFTYDQISSALSKLEGLGLMRSFYSTRPEFSEYVLELYAPKDPAAFSQDPLFMNLLNDILGPRHTQDLLTLFMLDRETLNKDEVTSSFAEIYANQIMDIKSDGIFNGAPLENVVGTVKIVFDRALFFNRLTHNRKILPSSLSTDEVKKIEQIAGLYNLTEDAISQKVGDYYDAGKKVGSRVDFGALTQNLQELVKYPDLIRPLRRHVNKLPGESEKIKLINDMEVMGPVDFLVKMNDGTKVAPADFRILETLALDYNLLPPVINALVYYTLYHNNNELVRALMEKNASLLARNKVVTALDALDTLERPPVKGRGRPRKGVGVEPKIEAKETPADDTDDPIWDELKKL
ncbi:MAG: Replication initiation and membrane attachment protein [Tenericutes bacterium ADurb.Bin239]|nr:MAG: Replication initiation and membrane attachment protein [Tenericutes bacterium ADurb.Bin239]